LNEQELNKCTQDITTFTCGQNFPVYHVKACAPCEVQIYVNAPAPKLRKKTCPIKYNFMDNANRGTIGVFYTRKSDHNYTV